MAAVGSEDAELEAGGDGGVAVGLVGDEEGAGAAEVGLLGVEDEPAVHEGFGVEDGEVLLVELAYVEGDAVGGLLEFAVVDADFGGEEGLAELRRRACRPCWRRICRGR